MFPLLPKACLLRLLRRYGKEPLQWHLEDPCFLHLDLFQYICQLEATERRDFFIGVIHAHWKRCGGCIWNIIARSEETSDPREREAYLRLSCTGQLVLLHAFGLLYSR